MAIKTRIHPKKGIKQYRERYLWKGEDGKVHDTMTRWCSSKAEAEKEARNLKELKERMAKDQKELQKSKLVKTVMEEWINELGKIAQRQTTDNTTSDVVMHQRAITLYKYHTPTDVLNMHVREIDVDTYRKWLDTINRSELGGLAVRNQRQAINNLNQYCANKGYYADPSLDMDIDLAIQRVKLKPKKVGKRKRYCPTVKDIKAITDQYTEFGFDHFENMYWYTLFMVLFYSGMRVEELIGLQWKSVHLKAKRPYIDIQNAISERENYSNVMSRIKSEIYHTKNNRSNRMIPIFHNYYSVLDRYKFRYGYEFGLDNIDECFVFPNINAKDKTQVMGYQRQKNILRELDRITADCGVEKTDSQMFRHGCATWLVTDKEHGGCGFSPAQAKDYFGHTSDEMVNNVYAMLNKRQRANRTSETFKDMAMINDIGFEDPEIIENTKITEKVMNRDLNEQDKEEAIISRIYMEMQECKEKGYVYHYTFADMFYIVKGLEDDMFNELYSSIETKLDRTDMDEIYMAQMKKLIAKERDSETHED